jgi:transposase-like protein
MERSRIPHGRNSKEFREEAVRLVTEGGLSAGEASVRLSLPRSTLENWVRAAKRGKLGEIGKSHRPLTELEVELAQVIVVAGSLFFFWDFVAAGRNR